MKWLKLYTEICNDPKIRLLSFEDRWHYVAILCAKADGLLDGPIPDRLLRVHLGLAEVEFESLQKRLLDVCLVDERWQPNGWENRQTSKDPTAAERQRKYRERHIKKSETVSNAVSNALRVTEAPLPEGEEEREEEKEVHPYGCTRTPHQKVIEVFNEICGDRLPRVRSLTDNRKRAIKAHHTGIMEGDLENWRGYFQRVRQSRFLMGEVKDWNADFDWLLRKDIPLQVLEGKYDR